MYLIFYLHPSSVMFSRVLIVTRHLVKSNFHIRIIIWHLMAGTYWLIYLSEVKAGLNRYCTSSNTSHIIQSHGSKMYTKIIFGQSMFLKHQNIFPKSFFADEFLMNSRPIFRSLLCSTLHAPVMLSTATTPCTDISTYSYVAGSRRYYWKIHRTHKQTKWLVDSCRRPIKLYFL